MRFFIGCTMVAYVKVLDSVNPVYIDVKTGNAIRVMTDGGGVFRYRVPKINVLIGTAGAGYIVTGKIYVHRLVAEFYYGKRCKKFNVHHKNHNVKDNRPDNLEWMPTQRNASLRKGHKVGTMLGVKIERRPNRKPFTAYIRPFKGTSVHIGSFDNQKDAEKAVRRVYIEWWGHDPLEGIR